MATINLATIDFSGVSGGGKSAKLQTKTAEMLLGETQIEITPDTGYDGMSKVSVSHAPVQDTKTETITSNGTYTIIPDDGYDAMMNTEVIVNVEGIDNNIKYMNKKPYADETGLAELGWDEDSINYYKYNNYLYPWENEKLTSEEIQTNLASCASSENWIAYKAQITFLPNNQEIKPTYFSECNKLKGIPLIDTSSKTNFNAMFYECEKLVYIPPINTSNGTIFGSENTYRNVGMFSYCTILENIPLIDTSKGEIFGSMFKYCQSLSSIPALDTSNGKIFNDMFYYCSSLTSVPALDTSNGINFNRMFGYCTTLETIPLINTGNGTNFSSMFYYCSSLTSVPALDTSNGTNFASMFSGCSVLTSIPPLDTSNGTNFDSMFYNCYRLTTIPELNVSNSARFSSIFYDCSNLTDITFTGSINANISFSSCTKLTYDSIKSILTACDATTNTNSKTVSFNRKIADQNGELQALVDDCVNNKSWTISGLTLTTETTGE